MRFNTLTAIAMFLTVSMAVSNSHGTQLFHSKFVSVKKLEDQAAPDLFEPGCPPPANAYQISAYEVSNAEYADFLNAVASHADRYGLYAGMQAEHFWGGIVRSGRDGVFRYKPKDGYAKLPVTFVSWLDAVRYVNWLHHGRPVLGGDLASINRALNSGAYDVPDHGGDAQVHRSRDARYFIPSCGEWRAAAFIAQAGGGQSFGAVNASSSEKSSNAPSGRGVNFYKNGWALPYPHLAAVDQYPESAGPNGTLNQAGNVMEWVESPIGGDQRMALGGSLFLPEDALLPTYKDSELPSKKLSSFGFRVARAAGISETFVSSYEEGAPRRGVIEGVAQLVSGDFEWVRVGDPGNYSDYRTGAGCVDRVFEIGRGEVTNSQYAEFLNAVAADADTHNLFVPDMGSGVVGGVLRTRVDNRWSYKAAPGMEGRPAAYLSWFSLARLANWLHYGRPKGKQVLGVTEGDAKLGAYDTSRFGEFMSGDRVRLVSPALLVRNQGARYFIPSDDEWYKAAYYDPQRAGLLKYWRYPTKSDVPPSNLKGVGANYQSDSLGEGSPYYVSRRGDFPAQGHYPVLDMAGNLWEWTESWRGLGGEDCWRCDIPTKGLRGGSFNYIEIGLVNTNIDPGYPADKYFVYGGRLARTVSDGEGGWCAPRQVRSAFAQKMNVRNGLLALVSLFAGIILIAVGARRFRQNW